MMKNTFIEAERIQRLWDIENIKTLMHKRVFLQTADQREEELDTMWVSGINVETASYGANWGYYVGMEAIRGYYLNAHEKALEKQKLENGAADVNLGNMYARPVSTGLVELALDGKTAKGLWYSIGHISWAQPDGTARVQWILGKIAVDFLREDDGWKIWHLVDSVDVDCEAGVDYGDYPVYVDWSSQSENPVRREFGSPTIEKLTHDVTFNWWDDYPSLPPRNYSSFSNDISYGPEGYRSPAVIGHRAGEGRNWR